MNITKLELIKVKPRWMFLKIYTDKDIIGLGEPILEGHCNAVEAVIKEYEEYLIGQDPLRIEHHVQALHRGGFYRGGPLMLSAISGIEQALWDIKGKYYNCPVYEMLGGKLTNRGAVISCIIMAVMVYVANYIDWGIIIAKEFNIGLFNGIGLVAPALNEGVIAMGDYIFNLILLYLFTALGAIPSIRNKMKARELNTSVYALPTPINDNNGAIID